MTNEKCELFYHSVMELADGKCPFQMLRAAQTLPVTKDGCVVGMEQSVWVIDDEDGVLPAEVIWDSEWVAVNEYDGSTYVTDCYFHKENADVAFAAS